VSLLVNTSYAEVFQLESVSKDTHADKVRHYAPKDLLEREEGKIFVINFLKFSSGKKYTMATKKYKTIFKDKEIFERIFDKETYEKIAFKKIDLFNTGKTLSMTIKTEVFWFSEGYEGVSTMYFMLKKRHNEWQLDWLVF